ncbi:hypothetical protein MLD38_023995 [Melastoma candidum]|uniref:Uncharacterized protein n=1 Tax=Melastoma candidum TaxID=119954 RepID=A0ACB9NXM6_9MYRT|nr:hypothetical protein MLD38_023995 [Melastoma candidum]
MLQKHGFMSHMPATLPNHKASGLHQPMFSVKVRVIRKTPWNSLQEKHVPIISGNFSSFISLPKLNSRSKNEKHIHTKGTKGPDTTSSGPRSTNDQIGNQPLTLHQSQHYHQNYQK